MDGQWARHNARRCDGVRGKREVLADTHPYGQFNFLSVDIHFMSL